MRTTIPANEGCATLLAVLGESAASLSQKTMWSSLVVFLCLCAASGTLQAQVTAQWVAYYDGPAHQDDQAFAIALDALGNVFVTGSSKGVDTGADYATVKYDPATGGQLWAARYDGPAH